jgi:hypothetical protein
MEKYRLVQEVKPSPSENDFLKTSMQGQQEIPQVRITQQGKPRNYISYAMNLFVSASCEVNVYVIK